MERRSILVLFDWGDHDFNCRRLDFNDLRLFSLYFLMNLSFRFLRMFLNSGFFMLFSWHFLFFVNFSFNDSRFWLSEGLLIINWLFLNRGHCMLGKRLLSRSLLFRFFMNEFFRFTLRDNRFRNALISDRCFLNLWGIFSHSMCRISRLDISGSWFL